MIFRRWGPKKFQQKRFQSIRPHLITLERGVQLIAIHHSDEKLSVNISQLRVDVQVAKLLVTEAAIGELRKILR